MALRARTSGWQLRPGGRYLTGEGQRTEQAAALAVVGREGVLRRIVPVEAKEAGSASAALRYGVTRKTGCCSSLGRKTARERRRDSDRGRRRGRSARAWTWSRRG